MGSKYHNKKVVRDGMTFDSVKEWRRWCELSMLEKAGKITNLERQVKFVLLPAQREPDIIGKKGGIERKGKTIERECSYIADFVYIENGTQIVEDVKGYKKGPAYTVFSIKRKLMLNIYNIRIVEV